MALTLAQATEWMSGEPMIHMLARPDVIADMMPSGKSWRCASGEYRWHRSETKARRCKFLTLPMVQMAAEVSAAFDEAIRA
jgi:hypothetical protein